MKSERDADLDFLATPGWIASTATCGFRRRVRLYQQVRRSLTARPGELRAYRAGSQHQSWRAILTATG